MKFSDIKWPVTLFVTGIGTDVGKSYATGWLARELAASGHSVTTQKFIQTGNTDQSEDIMVHRKLMKIAPTTYDLTRISSPYIFRYPASPHLAAKMEHEDINTDLIAEATGTLHKYFSHVLIEGAGGLMVPVTEDILTIDYIHRHKLPVILVTNGALGSISDTLLNLYVLAHYHIDIFGVVYNPYFDKDRKIAEETRVFLRKHLESRYPDALWFEMPEKL